MNRIELEWEHLKRDEIKGEMFESEAQLAYHVLEGIEARAEEHGHWVEYVNLRSTLILAPLISPVLGTVVK